MGSIRGEVREQTATAGEDSQHWSGLDLRHSSCLWFQTIGVEARSPETTLPELR